jgi:hypothetical protein
VSTVDPAVVTQLANIEKRTGKTLAELAEVVRGSGLEKHGQLVAMLKSTLGMGHGDANLVVHTVRQAASPPPPATPAAVLDSLYEGPKAALRPIHDAVVAVLRTFGTFEEAPKKAYVSYRRRRQFCTVGPATRTRVEVGLNATGLPASDRLEKLPDGHMCDLRVRLDGVAQVDDELIGWLRAAYDAAG